MKKRIILSVSLACVLLTGCAKEETPPITVAAIGQEQVIQKPLTTAFQNGEELIFDLKYLGFLPLGQAKAKVQEWNYQGQESYYLTVKVRSSKFTSFFYKVEDYIESYFDARSFRSLRFIEHLREGRHIMEKDTIYDQELHLATYNNKITKRVRQVLTREDTQDPLSALYFIRAQEFSKGKKIKCNVNNHKNNFRVRLKILKKEQIKTPAGDFLAWKTEVTMKARKGPQEGSMLLWFSVGEKKLPLLVKVKSPIGPVTGQLLQAKL
jgi:hypothetical protein